MKCTASAKRGLWFPAHVRALCFISGVSLMTTQRLQGLPIENQTDLCHVYNGFMRFHCQEKYNCLELSGQLNTEDSNFLKTNGTVFPKPSNR